MARVTKPKSARKRKTYTALRAFSYPMREGGKEKPVAKGAQGLVLPAWVVKSLQHDHGEPVLSEDVA